jgi:glycosyltransferase involved in cell wall biosynthesis
MNTNDEAATHERDIIEVLRRELLSERAVVDELRGAISRLEAENLALSESLNEIYGSRAWKSVSRARAVVRSLSRPLRRVEVVPEASSPPRSALTDSEPGPSSANGDIELLVEDVLVSVVIPVYNKGWDLLRAIESVTAQTLENVEIVVWDDGSTDPETLAAIHAVRDIPGVTVGQGPNRGLSAARNSAIGSSRGQLVCCLDPDDVLQPTYLEKAAALLLTHPDVAIAYPWQHTVGDKEEYWHTMDLDPTLIMSVNHLPVCAMFRREVFIATGGYNSEMREGYEDWEFWAHAAELGFAGRVIPEPLFLYTYSDDPHVSMHSRAKASHEDLLARIASFHPQLSSGLVPRRWEGSEPIHPKYWSLLRRRFRNGHNQPVVLTVPSLSGATDAEALESLLRHWANQHRTTVVVCTHTPDGGTAAQFTNLFALTPYIYCLPSFLPQEHWAPFVEGIEASLHGPVTMRLALS